MKDWIEPYRVVKAPKHPEDFWRLFYDTWIVEFEESTLFHGLTYTNAVRMVGALNGAYNMGRAHERLTQ